MSDQEDYDSEEDEDYVPEAEDVSEEENSGDEEDLSILDGDKTSTGLRERKQKKDAALCLRKRQGGIKLDNGETTDKQPAVQDDENKELKEQIELEKATKKEELEKKKADDLWSSFLSDVKPPPKKSTTSSRASSSKLSESTSEAKMSPAPVKEKTVEITKVFDFAGEEVKVTKTVDADSKEAKKELQAQEEKSAKRDSPSIGKSVSSPLANIGVKRPASGGGGLGGVLSKIGKKQKISVLEKSKMDWNNFKKDEGIEDEMKLHNNSKDGYIERMKFLQRTDHRQFEIEKNLRLSSKR